DKRLGAVRLVLVHHGDVHGRPGAGTHAREDRPEKQGEHQREAEHPEQPGVVAGNQPQVLQRQGDNGVHQSRKLLPVRLRKTVSRFGRSMRNVVNFSPADVRALASSNGLSVAKRSVRSLRVPGKVIPGGTSSTSASTIDWPPCLAIKPSTVSSARMRPFSMMATRR